MAPTASCNNTALLKDIDRQIGARIRQRRRELRLTLEQLAQLTNVTSQQIHKFETGMFRVRAAALALLAPALQVAPSFFYEDVLIGDAA